MDKLEKNKLLSIVLGVIVSGTILGFYGIGSTDANSHTKNQAIGILNTNLAFASYQPICSSNTQEVQQAMTMHKMPQSLPSGYSLQDGFAHGSGILSLWYAPGSICSKDSKYVTLEDGILQYYTRTLDSEKDSKLMNSEQYFKDFKSHSQRPQVMSLFKINGLQAIGWESGWKKSIVEFVNGTIVSEKDVQYPAEVQVIDPVSKNYYTFRGYFPLEELKNIARASV